MLTIQLWGHIVSSVMRFVSLMVCNGKQNREVLEENIKMKKTTLLATSAVVAAGFAASAVAVDVEMYGQVNKGFIAYDDGEATNTAVVDNDVSSSRLGVKGSQTLDNGLTVSVLAEYEMQSSASNAVTQNTTAGASTADSANQGASTLTERHTRVGIAGDFGAVWMGRTSSASDSTYEQDLAGAQDVMYSGISDIGGGLQFQNAGTYTGDTISGEFAGADGLGRGNAIRYDSPIWNGVQGRVSAVNGGNYDAAVYYSGKYDAFQVKAALGYAWMEARATGTNDVDTQLSTSVSVKHDSGIAGTIAYSKQNVDEPAANNEDPTSLYLKAGYAWDAFEVAADYSQSEAQDQDELTAYGLAAQYNMGHGVSTAAFYKTFDLDKNTGTDPDSINVFGVNMRVKF